MSDVDRFTKCPHGYYLLTPTEFFSDECLCPHGCRHVSGQDPHYVVFDETPLLPVTMVTATRQAAEEMYRLAEAMMRPRRTWWQRFLFWLGYAPRAAKAACMRCLSDEWTWCDYRGCSVCFEPEPFDFDAEESMVASDGGGGLTVVPPEGSAVGPMHGAS